MTTAFEYCSRITGTSATGPQVGVAGEDGPRNTYGRRLGEQRGDGRWDVLCDHVASFRVDDQPSCVTCLPAVIDKQLSGPGSSVKVSHNR